MNERIPSQSNGHADQRDFAEIGAVLCFEHLAKQQSNGIGPDVDGGKAIICQHNRHDLSVGMSMLPVAGNESLFGWLWAIVNYNHP